MNQKIYVMGLIIGLDMTEERLNELEYRPNDRNHPI